MKKNRMVLNRAFSEARRDDSKRKKKSGGLFTLDRMIRRGSRSSWPPLAALSMSIIAIRWLKKRMGPKAISMTIRPGERFIVSSTPKSRSKNL